MGEDGTKAICDALKINTTILELDESVSREADERRSAQAILRATVIRGNFERGWIFGFAWLLSVACVLTLLAPRKFTLHSLYRVQCARSECRDAGSFYAPLS